MAKSPAQLQREIDEVLTKGSREAHRTRLRAAPPQSHATMAGLAAPVSSASAERLTAKRAKNFSDSHNYEVRDASGTLIALLFRDPESREWYEDQMPGQPQTHYTDRWRGFTQADAMATIARRRRG